MKIIKNDCSMFGKIFIAMALISLWGIIYLSQMLLPEKPDAITMENRKIFSITLEEQYKNSFYNIGMANDLETENARVENTFEMLSMNIPLKYQVNAYNTDQTGIGFIKGSEYDNTNKALYIFTEEPNRETVPYGILYATIKDKTIKIGMGIKPQEDIEITVIED